MIRFTIRDLLWLTVVVALAVGLFLQYSRAAALEARLSAATVRQERDHWALHALIDLIEDREGSVHVSDTSVALYIVAKPWQNGPGWSSATRK